jgi:NADH:ubiquinone oxidoreductase subunit K
MSLNFFFLYITENLVTILYFSIFIFLSSWLGIAISDSFIEGLLFVEILYLALVLFASIVSILINNPIIDLFIIFMIFFTVCDSILGLILTLITFKTVKNIQFKFFIHLTG